MDGLGLGYADLAAVNPALVHVSVTAVRPGRPQGRVAGDRPDAHGQRGTLVLTGDADRPPVRVTLPQAFHFGAAVGAGGTRSWRSSSGPGPGWASTST